MKRIFNYSVLFFTLVIFYQCSESAIKTTSNKEKLHEDIWYLTTNANKKKNVELFVKEIGIGDTVVVVHGGFGAEHSYLIDFLKPMYNKYHFVYYDQRGSLRSPVKNDSLITAMSHVDDLEKLRKELQVKKLNILAHSMGTWVSSAYLNKYPANVKSMTLLGLVWPKQDMTDEENKLYNASDDAYSKFISRKEVKEEMESEGLTKKKLSSREQSYKWQIRFASANIYDIKKWRNLKGGMVFFNQKASTAAGRSMPQDYDWIQAFKNNPQVPITVINGSHDLVDFGGVLHKTWLEPLSNVSYFMIENAGHNSWVDQPEKVTEIVVKSLKL